MQWIRFSTRGFTPVSLASFPSYRTRGFTSQREILSKQIRDGPSLGDFISQDYIPDTDISPQIPPYFQPGLVGGGRNVFIETYGCQMNVSDSELVSSIMQSAGYNNTTDLEQADIVFLNTCAIRDKAEQKIWDRLQYLKHLKTKKKRDLRVGVLGCMAERLKEKLLETDRLVDIVAGPDAYRSLPALLAEVETAQRPALDVALSLDETYADVAPVRLLTNGVSAFVSIMRGCNNMCSYCIVPFTRGRERSRPIESIEAEVRDLSQQGYKEIVLLGQNVNSYNFIADGQGVKEQVPRSAGFRSMVQPKGGGIRFGELLARVAAVDPEMRVRFTSPHPKDFPEEVLLSIRDNPNICNSLHLPAQSGSSAVLERMRRGYTREAYLDLVETIREILPGCTLSSDFISGFCGETEEEHQETLSLLRHVRKLTPIANISSQLIDSTQPPRDDVPQEVKLRRLQEVITTFTGEAKKRNEAEIGSQHLVLVEGPSKKSKVEWSGRTDTNKTVVFPEATVPSDITGLSEAIQPGDYVLVEIDSATSHTLRGKPLRKRSLTQHANAQ